MKRWHEELPLMLRRWLPDLAEHEMDRKRFPRLYGNFICKCEKAGPGIFRKRKPHDCGKTRCRLCHWEKYCMKGNSRHAREYQAIQWEETAWGAFWELVDLTDHELGIQRNADFSRSAAAIERTPRIGGFLLHHDQIGFRFCLGYECGLVGKQSISSCGTRPA